MVCECWKHGGKPKAENGGNPLLNHKSPISNPRILSPKNKNKIKKIRLLDAIDKFLIDRIRYGSFS